MFNFELYKEGLRKTKVLAILFLAGMILGAIFQPLVEISNLMRGIREGWRWAGEVIHVSGLHGSLMMPFALFAGAPILTLSIFSFLNKRSSSDFYHAIPHKRETLFGSFILAVLTWVLGGMWISTAISVLIYETSSVAVVNLGSVLLVLLGMSAACLLVISATTLAMTLTGTALSNIIASGLILFLPRLLMSVFIGMIIQGTRIVDYADFGLFGNFSRNIPIGFLTGGGSVNNESIDQMITRGTVYTFVLAVIYLIVAGYLFKRRHSELAGNPGSRLTQPIIRIAVTFCITLPAIGIISQRSDDIFGILIFYLIALVSYFAYEFFTTKRIPELIKMMPGLLIVVILNLGFILGVRAGHHTILQEIDVDHISSITIVSLDGNSSASLNARGLEIHDEQIVQFLGETLNDNIRISNERLRGNTELDWWGGLEIRVTFNFDGGRNLTRHFRVIEESRAAALLTAYEPYQALYLVIPENFDFDWVSSWDDLTSEETHQVLDVLREEIKEVDFSSWYQLVGSFSHFDVSLSETSGLIWVSGTIDGYSYHDSFPITELTPRALELYQSYIGD